jgi:hypothetical protein
MKKFNKDKQLLSAYIDGELSISEKKSIEEKIKSSLELQKELSDLKRLKELISTSYESLTDSSYFETRVLASLKQAKSSRFNFRRWAPAIGITIVTFALIVVFKINPNFLNEIIEQQKSNIAGFYKENLQPLLFAADINNEDIFNFAVYQQLPLDKTNEQFLTLGSDPQGSEYFEINKKNKIDEKNNFKNFVSALNLDDKETKQIDSIIGSYSEQLSSLVLVNDKNAVAINPNIWNTRKAILADIVSFSQSHAKDNFNKLIPAQSVNFDKASLNLWVNENKNKRDNQYIFFTPDSIFTETFEFDMKEFKKNMEKMEKELTKMDKKNNILFQFKFNMDSSLTNLNKELNWQKGFKVFVDTNSFHVSIPDINIPRMDFPNFDSLTYMINELTKNLVNIKPNLPQIPYDHRSFKIEVHSGDSLKFKKFEFNLDSLMNFRKGDFDSLRSGNFHNFNFFNDSLQGAFKFFFNDSLMLMQNEQLKREMDKLRQELKKFREEMKKDNQQNQFREIKNNSVEIIEI